MTTTTVARLAERHGRSESYGYLDEDTKRSIRRALLKALAVPGWQVPFTSREMPVARGWGSGGLQVTLSLVGPDDCIKVIDQGDDHSANASAMRSLICRTTGARETTVTAEATIVQSRHRIPETGMGADQILVLQVPHPEPLRRVVPGEVEARTRHGDGDYTPAWLELYDDEARHGGPRNGADHPVLVEGRTLMSPSPIPRHDVLRLDQRAHPVLLGAGRRSRVTAVPPHTSVRPLAFDDRPLQSERADAPCARCGSHTSYRVPSTTGAAADPDWLCSDTDACRERRAG
ncbi:alpha-D-ribose 1-methylphosphonate 5-phosphate C-P-lyase PhnJ [Pseudonocardia sichuanensis]